MQLQTAQSTAANSSATDGAATASDHKELTLYTAIPESEIPYYFTPFENETGIKINYVRLSGGEMFARVRAEKENPQASMMFCVTTDIYMTAMEEGLLEAYRSPENENVLPQFAIDADGFDDSCWNPWSVTLLSLACNREWFEANNLEYPKTWDDLLKPEFQGQISIPHPTTSSAAYVITSTIIQKMGEEDGWEYLRALNNNVRQYTKSGSAPLMEVALGEAAIAIAVANDAIRP